MLGNIYTDQRCPICNGKFVDMGPKYGFRCPVHKEIQARRVRAKVGKLYKRFSGPGAYELAQQWLGGIRAKIGDPDSHGKFDKRDYDRSNPLAFVVLVENYLSKKEDKVSKSQFRSIRNTLKRAIEAWGDTNIKNIEYAEIEDFLDALKVSSKTRANYKSDLHAFFVWVCKRYSKGRNRLEMPEFPETPFELKYRTITDKETQFAILDQIMQDRADEPRVWMAIQWLTRYAALRPDDIRRIKESDVDYRSGKVTIERPTKRKKARTIFLIEEDLELISGLTRGLPYMPLFRHDKSFPGCPAGSPFGKSLLYNTWTTACRKLGITGLSLYAGTRHTTTTALQEHVGREDIRFFTQHETNQAFERYLFPDRAKQISLAELAANRKKNPQKSGDEKVVNLNPKK